MLVHVCVVFLLLVEVTSHLAPEDSLAYLRKGRVVVTFRICGFRALAVLLPGAASDQLRQEALARLHEALFGRLAQLRAGHGT
jgi:hypothetical protein